MTSLVDSLRIMQEKRRLTNAQMAAKLGYSHSQNWLRALRTGKFNHELLMHTRQAFPELKSEIDLFLAGNMSSCHNKDIK